VVLQLAGWARAFIMQELGLGRKLRNELCNGKWVRDLEGCGLTQIAQDWVQRRAVVKMVERSVFHKKYMECLDCVTISFSRRALLHVLI
jgi:hypothetical protein